jgi:bacillithiol biosynthesis cysteine-adding enzyme BshC
MPTDCIEYLNTKYFSEIINDYLKQNIEFSKFYNRFPSIENFKSQIDEKSLNFSSDIRAILQSDLQKQSIDLQISDLSQSNINLLGNNSTFTITTGHQLNIFTGPIYFLYKIVSTINLCKQLKETYPNFDFVPVYWMATEDHDFDEISYFNLNNKKIRWNKNASGAVGRLDTEGLDAIYQLLENELGIGKTSEYLKTLFQKSYLAHKNLADATRFLVNELFGSYGLVIIDGDSPVLKSIFTKTIKSELVNNDSFRLVNETISEFKNYKVQVNPREINLFFIENGLRERIIFDGNNYQINNTNRFFTEKEILALVDSNPEKFSPNVILRPLYQETILPNLCYIGGGGELAYWFELKSMFEFHKTAFPILLLRDSVLIVSKKQTDKMHKLNLSFADLFLSQNDLINSKVNLLIDYKIDFYEQKIFLEQQFNKLFEIAKQTDKSFANAVLAQQKKQTNGLSHLEKRFLKAQKRKHSEFLLQTSSLQNDLFPNQSLQERYCNFAQFYDDNFIKQLIFKLSPLDFCFKIIKQ